MMIGVVAIKVLRRRPKEFYMFYTYVIHDKYYAVSVVRLKVYSSVVVDIFVTRNRALR